MFGYGGRILTVDVTTGEQRIEEFDAAFARAYLGGNGFAAKLCYDRIPPGIDAFDPRNLVVIAVGPITDSVIPGNNHMGDHMGDVARLSRIFAALDRRPSPGSVAGCLRGVSDARGITFLTNQYSASGRVICQIQADGGE